MRRPPYPRPQVWTPFGDPVRTADLLIRVLGPGVPACAAGRSGYGSGASHASRTRWISASRWSSHFVVGRVRGTPSTPRIQDHDRMGGTHWQMQLSSSPLGIVMVRTRGAVAELRPGRVHVPGAVDVQPQQAVGGR